MAARIPLALFNSFLLPILFLCAPSCTTGSQNLLVPVTKDSKTLQHLALINQRRPSLNLSVAVDVGGPYLWLNCDSNYISSTYYPALCEAPICTLADLFSCSDCFSSPRPGCNNHTCRVIVENPFTQTSTPGELAIDVLNLYYTDEFIFADYAFLFSCAPAFLARGLAASAAGVIGLGRSHAAPPLQFYKKIYSGYDSPAFALCLSPTPRSPGALFFGRGPYVNDVALHYTPILTNPFIPFEYFIGVTAIEVGDTILTLNSTLLAINKETGLGGTKISTAVPYTALETSIYDSLTRKFAAALANLTRMAAVAPFELCYDARDFEATRFGPGAPLVRLVLQAGVSWSIYGANSMVEAKDGVLCFGFVDGGRAVRTSIVLGGHQIEDNLLQFDLSLGMLGFSESLLPRGISCSNSHFTMSGASASA